MLKPERISENETKEILKEISRIAQKEEQLTNSETSLLEESNIYQYELPELPNSEIILTEEIFIRLCGLAALSDFYEQFKYEYGCYLFGKDLGNNRVLFHTLNDVASSISTRSFDTSEEMAGEIEEKIKDKNIDCVCHVHTHPNGEKLYSGTPSNQDLYVYAWLKEQFLNSSKDVFSFGALITPTEDTKESFNDICFIFYDKNNKQFYKATNIYYLIDNKKIPLKKEIYYQKRNSMIESVENRTVLLKLYK